MALMLAPRSAAASGMAGTNICIASVPLKVTSTSSHNGWRSISVTGMRIGAIRIGPERAIPRFKRAEKLLHYRSGCFKVCAINSQEQAVPPFKHALLDTGYGLLTGICEVVDFFSPVRAF